MRSQQEATQGDTQQMPPPLSKTASPLGATVADYVAGRAFLLRYALPGSLALLAALLLLRGACDATFLLPAPRCAPPLRLLAAAALLAAGAGAGISIYGLARIAAWLPTVPEPCYELARAAGGAPLAPPRGLALRERGAWEIAATAGAAARAALVLRAKYSDRLGNNVFQYVHARLRAAFLDVAFEAPALGGPFGSAAVRVERWSATEAGGSSGGGGGGG